MKTLAAIAVTLTLAYLCLAYGVRFLVWIFW